MENIDKIIIEGILAQEKENSEIHIDKVRGYLKTAILKKDLEVLENIHKDRHKLLHKEFDELVADFIQNTNKLPSKTKVIELMKWSFEQTGEERRK
jgi:hypothetical protein